MSKTAIFLTDKEIGFIQDLLNQFENDNYMELNNTQQKQLDNLISVFALRGVEEKGNSVEEVV